MRWRTLSFLAALLACTGIPSVAIAQSSEGGGLDRFGYTAERRPGEPCAVVMVLDQSAFIAAVPQLKTLGLLNEDYVTQTIVNVRPIMLSMTFMLEAAPGVIRQTFEDAPKDQACKFTQYLLATDDLGNDSKRLVYSFGFTRALYDKVNWDKFQPPNLIKVAPNFRPDESFMASIAAENAAASQP